MKADCQIHFSQIHFGDVLIAVNSVLSFEPNPFTAAVMARLKRAIAQTADCGHFTSVSDDGGKGPAMARFCAAILLLAVLPGWTDTRGMVRVEAASPGRPYDFVVHVRNIPDIKYNPLVRKDRNRMALALVRGECPRGRVVGEDTVTTEIYGITSSLPDYVVLVSCARR